MKWGYGLGGLAMGILLTVTALFWFSPRISAWNSERAFHAASDANNHAAACRLGQDAAVAWENAGDYEKSTDLRGQAAVDCLLAAR